MLSELDETFKYSSIYLRSSSLAPAPIFIGTFKNSTGRESTKGDHSAKCNHIGIKPSFVNTITFIALISASEKLHLSFTNDVVGSFIASSLCSNSSKIVGEALSVDCNSGNFKTHYFSAFQS